jgi:HlyD family secretion protein
MMKRLSIALPAAGVILLGILLVVNARKLPHSNPLIPPPRSPYANTIAASGIVEATGQNQSISATVAGVMTKLYVHQGEVVKKGAPLFQIDPRQQEAAFRNAVAGVRASTEGVAVSESAVQMQMAAVRSTQAAIASTRATYENAAQIAARDKVLHREGIVDDQDYITAAKTRDADRALWQQQIALLIQAKAQLKNTEATLAQQQANLKAQAALRDQQAVVLGQLTVRAPRDGTVLQINNYPGEYIASIPTTPTTTANPAPAALLFGATYSSLQVRADVDEINASNVRPGAPATAELKGDSTRTFPLRFLRIDPYMIPKQNLTGNNSELVDVRVLEVIYRFDPPKFPVYAGQQVDVFIQDNKGRQAVDDNSSQHLKGR